MLPATQFCHKEKNDNYKSLIRYCKCYKSVNLKYTTPLAQKKSKKWTLITMHFH